MTLSQDGKVLRLTVKQAATAMDVEDVAGLLSERFDAPVPGYRCIVVRLRTATGKPGALDVTARLIDAH